MAKLSALFDDGTGNTSADVEVRTSLVTYPQYELVDVDKSLDPLFGFVLHCQILALTSKPLCSGVGR